MFIWIFIPGEAAMSNKPGMDTPPILCPPPPPCSLMNLFRNLRKSSKILVKLKLLSNVKNHFWSCILPPLPPAAPSNITRAHISAGRSAGGPRAFLFYCYFINDTLLLILFDSVCALWSPPPPTNSKQIHGHTRACAYIDMRDHNRPKSH